MDDSHVSQSRAVRPLRRRLPAALALAASLAVGLAAAAALLAALGGPAALAWAAPAGVTRSYPGSGVCATTLQACLDGAAPGDTVLVQPGTYATSTLTLSQAVNLTGVNSATVILQALPGQRVLTITSAAVDSSVVISGLTFAGGQALGATCPVGCGGAIYITGTAQPRLVNLILRDNQAGVMGGAVFAEAGSPLSLSGVRAFSNTLTGTTGFGGAVFAVSPASVSGSLFEHNACAAQCFGGALYAQLGLTLTSSRFYSNTATGFGVALYSQGPAHLTGAIFQDNACTANCFGGAAYLQSAATISGGMWQGNTCLVSCIGGALYAQSPLTVTGTHFADNLGQANGGAVYAQSPSVFSGALFQDNQCQDSGCAGGGLYAQSALFLTGTQFIHNTSGNDGGGVFAQSDASVSGGLFQDNQCSGPLCDGGGLEVDNNLVLTGTRFISNTSTGEGGGVFVFMGALVTNTVFISNQAEDGGGLYQCEGGGWGEYANDLFAGNLATKAGSGLLLGSPVGAAVRFTTFAAPTDTAGVALYVTSGTVTITDTIFDHYTVGLFNDGGSVSEDYNLFSHLSGLAFNGVITSGGHSTSRDTAFANPAAGNFHLPFGSPAIDAGVDAGLNVDFDGNHRPFGAGFDIGYDEYSTYRVYLPLVRR